MVGDFAEYVGILMLPLVLIAGVVAMLISGMVTVLRPGSLVTRLGHAGVAVVLGSAAAWLALYASGEDTYYGGGVSRWEHAGRAGGTLPVALAMIIAVATSLALAASAAAPRRRLLRMVAAPAALVSCVLLLFGWMLLTAGH